MVSSRSTHGLNALKVEGRILPPEFIHSISNLQASNQDGIHYGLSESLALKEELARYWRISSDLYRRYAERRDRFDLSASLVGIDDWLEPFLRTVLGFDDLEPTQHVVLNERMFILTHTAHGGSVPLILLTDKHDLDKPGVQLGNDGSRHAAHASLQEYLNTQYLSMWGIVSNGSKIRILRDNPSLTRTSYLEVDLDLLFQEELYSDFTAFWLTAHASRLKPVNDKPSECILESWRTEAHEIGERAREHLRDGVTHSLQRLGNGFLQHPSNNKLRADLRSGQVTSDQYFEQLLRLVYRLLFLLTAEDRDLLHIPEATKAQRTIFREGYSLARLRERATLRRNYDGNHDLWRGLQITFGGLEKGAPGLGIPALGGLFRSVQCAHLNSASISNNDLLEAVRTLTYFRADRTIVRVNYRDMDTEELGSVYESLLELRPEIDVNSSPWTYDFGWGEHRKSVKGSKRKLTGSYYTPPSLVSELIKSTLEPVLKKAIHSRQEDPRSAVLNLKILDPACGSGHFLLAAARRVAVELARIDSQFSNISTIGRQHALREVVQNCIYGVDRNPLAIDLCKTALWIETVEPGKPLTFLDAHVVIGDSLMGILDSDVMADGIPNEAYKDLTGDDKSVCLDLKKRNKQRGQGWLFEEDTVLEVALDSLDLDEMSEDTLEDIDRKRKAHEKSLCSKTRSDEVFRADLFLSAFFVPKVKESLEIIPYTGDIERIVNKLQHRPGVSELVGELRRKHHFHHWHLVFAEIMQQGGFDVILGNPPWERLKLQEQEFFALRSPSIAAAHTKATRHSMIRQLKLEDATSWDRALYREFLSAKRDADAASQYARTSGRFPLTGIGDLNTYPVFAETALQLLSPRGRAGLILPTGIATDYTTRDFFNHLVNSKRLVSLFDFENRQKLFSSIDGRIKFCLLTFSGEDNSVAEGEFAFYLHRVEQLRESRRRFTLSATDFEMFNPNTRTCPIFRTQDDVDIARKMYQRAGILWKDGNDKHTEDNPWGVKLSTMFHMSNDSALFRTRENLLNEGAELMDSMFVLKDRRYMPLYEAKLFHQYDHRFATFEGASTRDIQQGNARPMTSEEKRDIDTVSIPRYWVDEQAVVKRISRTLVSQQSAVSSQQSAVILEKLGNLAHKSFYGK